MASGDFEVALALRLALPTRTGVEVVEERYARWLSWRCRRVSDAFGRWLQKEGLGQLGEIGTWRHWLWELRSSRAHNADNRALDMVMVFWIYFQDRVECRWFGIFFGCEGSVCTVCLGRP